MKKSNSLSEIEWQVMTILWKKGVLSIKEVWKSLYPNGEKAYTTVQTYMDRMVGKQLLRKEKIGLVNFYHAIVNREKLMKQATDGLVSKVFNGSFGNLAAYLVNSNNLSDKDLDKIRNLIIMKEEEEKWNK